MFTISKMTVQQTMGNRHGKLTYASFYAVSNGRKYAKYSG